MAKRVLTGQEKQVLQKVLLSDQVQNLIGGEEWDLTENEEMLLWKIIKEWKGD